MKTQILFFLLAALLIGAAIGCDKIERNPPSTEIVMNTDLSTAIARIADKKRGNPETVTFNLKDYAKFDWDKVFVFTPHTPHDAITQKVGALPASAFADIESRDDICLLIFTKNGKPVQAAEIKRGKGDFSQIPSGGAFTVENAVFEAREENRGEPWIMIFPAENN